eukprot:8115780-Pyramimonas_sp.AAC.1
MQTRGSEVRDLRERGTTRDPDNNVQVMMRLRRYLRGRGQTLSTGRPSPARKSGGNQQVETTLGTHARGSEPPKQRGDEQRSEDRGKKRPTQEEEAERSRVEDTVREAEEAPKWLKRKGGAMDRGSTTSGIHKDDKPRERGITSHN